MKQKPIQLAAAKKRSVRTQFAALCYRNNKGKVEILLVTGRRSGRWILPKGWPMDGQTPAAAAETEAFEEAGVTGKMKNTCVGLYSYIKGKTRGDNLPCVVAVFPLKVKTMQNDYPERAQRKRKWFSQAKAAARVSEKELAQLIRGFDPKRLKADKMPD